MGEDGPVDTNTVDIANKADAKQFINDNIDVPDGVVMIEVTKVGQGYKGVVSTQ